MAISFENAIGMREQAMRLRADRASVLASNLANADTPGFKARDIDFQAELKARTTDSGSQTLRSTHSGHIGVADLGLEGSERLYRIPSQPSIDGNSVEEHVEHSEFMKNSLEFQVAFQLLNSGFKGLSKAVRGE